MHMAVVTTASDQRPDQDKHWTAAEWRELPEDRNRYEIIDGELFVTPAPIFDHQRLVFQLAQQVSRYASEISIGEAAISPADIELADDTVVQPDVFVVPLVAGVRPRHVARRDRPSPCRRGSFAGHGSRGPHRKASPLPKRRCAGVLDRGRRCAHRRALAAGGREARSSF